MKKFLTEKFSIVLLVSGILFLFVGLTFFLWNDLNFSILSKVDSDKIGQFGDFVGGLIGSIWALAGVILFYVALTEQRKDFKNNRDVLITQTESLKQQIKEFKLQRLELSETRKVFEIQIFETSFFNLLKFHSDVKNSLNISTTKIRTTDKVTNKETFEFRGNRFFLKANQFIEYHLFEFGNIAIIKQEKKLSYIINYFSNKYKLDGKTLLLIKEIFNENKVNYKQKIAFLIFYEGYKSYLSQYMNLLITVVKIIEDASQELESFSSEKYFEILKAQLSEMEIKITWVYLHTFQKKAELKLFIKHCIIPKQMSLFEPKDYTS